MGRAADTSETNQGNKTMKVIVPIIVALAVLVFMLMRPANAAGINLSYEECAILQKAVTSVEDIKATGMTRSQTFMLYMSSITPLQASNIDFIKNAINIIDFVYIDNKASSQWMGECVGA